MATGRPRATHCRRGHEFTPENTMVRPNGRRQCRICKRKREASVAFREARNARRRERQATDLDFRAGESARKRASAYRERENAQKRDRYHSIDPETHRRVSVALVRKAMRRRASRAAAAAARPHQSIDLQFIDRIIQEELGG